LGKEFLQPRRLAYKKYGFQIKSNQIKYIFATKNNNMENIQGIIKSKEAQKKPKGL
jgi:hypothetical protein